MKSNKQRRAEIRARRLERAARIEAQLRLPDQRHPVSYTHLTLPTKA